MDADRIVSLAARRPFEQSLRAGRLARLARMGLAEDIGRGAWRLADGLEETLRRMGERGDIIRTMQRAFAGRGDAPAPADRGIYDPSVSGGRRSAERRVGKECVRKCRSRG